MALGIPQPRRPANATTPPARPRAGDDGCDGSERRLVGRVPPCPESEQGAADPPQNDAGPRPPRAFEPPGLGRDPLQGVVAMRMAGIPPTIDNPQKQTGRTVQIAKSPKISEAVA